MKKEISPTLKSRLLKFQRDEITGSVLYEKIALRQKDENNKNVLLKIAAEEKQHAAVMKSYTGESVKPNALKIWLLTLLGYILGFTFTIKIMEINEEFGIKEYEQITLEIPELGSILLEEKAHEESLISMLDESRLQYVGSMVLGLNDALVELTGTIAGLTFALGNTRLVALAGIITGISATLSMAASNYLAERAEGNPNAFKSSLYTGAAYLVTVVLMVLPYLIFPNDMYLYAFITMLATVILIILFFNYYISVAKSQPFLKNFLEMALISLGVALISFLIGMLAKQLLGIEV